MSAEQIKQRVKDQFGGAGDAYVVSATHREGDDLARLVEVAELNADVVALDVATGGGHTGLALAPHVRHVTFSDLTPRMLEHAEDFVRSSGVENADFQVADAEDLPFADASFDLVTCRIAPHHFANVRQAVREVARVLRPGGLFLLLDSAVPEDPALDELINTLERRRDPSHVRSYTIAEWTAFLDEAGLAVELSEIFLKRHEYGDWTARSRMTAEDREALVAWVLAWPPEAKATVKIEEAGGRFIAFTDEKVLMKARKRV